MSSHQITNILKRSPQKVVVHGSLPAGPVVDDEVCGEPTNELKAARNVAPNLNFTRKCRPPGCADHALLMCFFC